MSIFCGRCFSSRNLGILQQHSKCFPELIPSPILIRVALNFSECIHLCDRRHGKLWLARSDMLQLRSILCWVQVATTTAWSAQVYSPVAKPNLVLDNGPWVLLMRRGVRKTASHKIATWLILPVVICLSQRLSHACLSINNSILWNCEWLIKSVIVYLIIPTTWITVVILELIHAKKPDFWKGCIY